MPHKIGSYVRVSTEEQAQVVEGSIESQQHRLKWFVESKSEHEKNWGKIVDTYIDDGYSAKDTRRPAYQRMMRDIHSGKINLILVPDISRLSRNIHDFCLLLKDLEDCKAKFLSVKEQFDTSSPAGEMMIYNMINLAQFERRQTGERVSMNFHSRALRGLMSGGNPILGYDKDPNNKGKLVVNAEESPMVRRIFEIYLETGSRQEAVRRLNTLGISPKIGAGRKCRHAIDGRWTVSSVATHLKNLAYVGKLEVNRRFKDEDRDTLKLWQQYQIVDASWPAIIDEETFNTVQRLLEENRIRERARFSKGQTRVFLLSGIMRCGECERALIGQTAHGRSGSHRYYGHKIIVGETNTCKIKRFRADEIEQAVIQHLDEMLLRAGYLDTVELNIRTIMGGQEADAFVEKERVQKDLMAVEKDIESVFQLHAEMAGNADIKIIIREKLEKLAERKRALTAYLESIESRVRRSKDAKEARSVIENKVVAFKRGWQKASSSTQKRLIRRLIDTLVYTPEGLQAYYVTANDAEVELPISKSKKASESSSGAVSSNFSFHTSQLNHPDDPFSYAGSSVGRAYGGGGNRTPVRK